MADFPKWLVVDEGEAPVHVTLTPADAVATIGMSLYCQKLFVCTELDELS